MSTYWLGLLPAQNNPIITDAFLKYLQANAPSFKTHKFYFDTGTVSVDWYSKPIQMKVDNLFQAKGYNQNNFLSREFKGADHSVKSWKARIDIPIGFLLSDN
jgi:hypothetical protein